MNRRLTLASSVVGAMVVAFDGTALMIAQPTLRRELDASLTEVQWTGTGYLVAVAALLVCAGRLGDRYGHHRAFAVGMLGFGAASAGIAVAPTVGWIIGLRVLQGVFGALLQPATLGMLRVAYPAEGLRRPIALRTAAIGLAAATGPLLGGTLTTAFGWRSVFLLNVVPAAVLGTLALTRGRRERTRTTVAVDPRGALWFAVALAAVVHTLVDPLAPAALPGAVLAVVAGAAFVRHERRTTAPLLPSAVVTSPSVRAALALLVVVSAALNGALFTTVFALQDGRGLSPTRTALVSLPLAVLLVASAAASAVLLRRVGARRTVAGATAVLSAGLLLLASASTTAGLALGFGLLGAGFGTVMVAATHVVVRQAPVESAGVAGGLQQTALNVGPVLGVAAATLMADGGARPLLVAAVAAVAALPLCRALPGPGLPGRALRGRSGAAESGAPGAAAPVAVAPSPSGTGSPARSEPS